MPVVSNVPPRSTFLGELGIAELITVGAGGAVVFGSGHKNPAVFASGTTVSDVTALGCTAAGAGVLLVIG